MIVEWRFGTNNTISPDRTGFEPTLTDFIDGSRYDDPAPISAMVS